jgi:hypothetical protein
MIKSLIYKTSKHYLLRRENLICNIVQSYPCSSEPNFKRTQPMIWEEFFEKDKEVGDKTKEAFLQCISIFFWYNKNFFQF